MKPLAANYCPNNPSVNVRFRQKRGMRVCEDWTPLHTSSFLLLPWPEAHDKTGEAWRNPLVEMLARNAQRLPDWLGLVVTSRPEFDVKTPLQALNLFPVDTKSESNRADIRDANRMTVEGGFAATFGTN